ncbi:hypothetical protein PIROE2DRAFT_7184, partial [Piromyces sp. E2]
MNSQFDMWKEPNKKYYDQFCEKDADEKFKAFRKHVIDYTNENYNRTLQLSLDQAFMMFVQDQSPFFRGKASHYYLLFEEEEEGDNKNKRQDESMPQFSSVLPPKNISPLTEHYLIANKNTFIDKDILMETARILTSKEMQLYKVKHFGSIPTFDFSKKNDDNEIKNYCDKHSKICEHYENLKKFRLKDLFDSRYTPAFFEVRLLLPSVIKRYIMSNNLERLKFGFENIKELVTSFMGAYSYLTYCIISIYSILIFTVIGLTYYYKNHPYLKAISPLFCIIIILGYLLTTIGILMFLPPFSIAKCKIFYMLEILSYTLIVAPMYVITYRIYRIFKSGIIDSKSLSNKRLFIYVVIFNLIAVIYKFIVIFAVDFHYIAYGYLNESRRLARYYFTNYTVFDTVDSIIIGLLYFCLLIMIIRTGSASKKFGDISFIYVIILLNIIGFITGKIISQDSIEHFSSLFFILSIIHVTIGCLSTYLLVGGRLIFIILYKDKYKSITTRVINSADLAECVPLKLNKNKYFELLNKLIKSKNGSTLVDQSSILSKGQASTEQSLSLAGQTLKMSTNYSTNEGTD